MNSPDETYYLFLDESGDHGLNNLDEGFPVFVLCGVLISKTDYFEIRDKINELKNEIWGNKEVIFHSRDIRKCEKEFKLLLDWDTKSFFYERLDGILDTSNYTVIAATINKKDYIHKYGRLNNDVYELSFSFIIERSIFCLDDLPFSKALQIIIEKRGKNEDRKLTMHFDKIITRGTGFVTPERLRYLGMKINFRSKIQNVNGLQLADLIAYPIARYSIDPTRANPAFDLIKSKIYMKNNQLYGLKIFP